MLPSSRLLLHALGRCRQAVQSQHAAALHSMPASAHSAFQIPRKEELECKTKRCIWSGIYFLNRKPPGNQATQRLENALNCAEWDGIFLVVCTTLEMRLNSSTKSSIFYSSIFSLSCFGNITANAYWKPLSRLGEKSYPSKLQGLRWVSLTCSITLRLD